MGVRRYDVGRLDAPKELANGRLRVDGRPTRAGIFVYRNPDGSLLRELRPPEEVFSDASLESLRCVPVTDDHPAEMVGCAPKEHARGVVSDDVRKDGDHVRASLTIWDADLVAKMKSGKKQLSCGYTADLDMTPGTWNGEPYDAVQRSITYDHLAVVDVGRAGPSASARVDRTDAVQVSDVATRLDSNQQPQEKPMLKFKIDGVECEVPELAAQLVEKERATAKAKVDAAEAQIATAQKATSEAQAKADAAVKATKDAETALQAKLDDATDKLAKSDAALKDATDPAKVRDLIDARVALERVAAEHLDGVDVAKLSARDIKIALVEKAIGKKLDAEKSKSDVYVDARYEAALEQFDAETPHLDAARKAADDPSARKDAVLDEDSAAKKRIQELDAAYAAAKAGK